MAFSPSNPMALQLQEFFRACNPSKTLNLADSGDRHYYIDFAAVRGGKIIEALARTITRLSPEEPTCQLFTGHIGCGKSTELLRLKALLERENFEVIYFESSRDLDMEDVSISDILLAVARSVSEHLEGIGISLKPSYFKQLFDEIKDFLQTPVQLDATAELSLGLARITARTKESPRLRQQIRQSLEPRTEGILRSINEELLGQGNLALKGRGKKGLVVIIDNLDRISSRQATRNRSLPEYLFIDRGQQLRRLNCHVIYTIPLALIFSNEYQALKNRLGGGVAPKMLPMVPIQKRDRTLDTKGLILLQQLVLAQAFPHLSPRQRIACIPKLFDSNITLNRLCLISGGHVRTLLGLLYNCLQQNDPPFNRDCIEVVIKGYRDDILLAVEDNEWQMLAQVMQQQTIRGEQEYQILLRSLFVYEYQDQQGRWFGINPALAETTRFKHMLRSLG
ncbi:ATP-binding protein [[Limnothrix rosea] IAM M-220]|uniref:ATP-binding protein n=1 Tax=[Limnothrix rosea] IAM M-220 TaxID=454133 RepID=UPI00111589FC|nr:ATP-binding protein [[Limnothrix rosea] IAM M-220]